MGVPFYGGTYIAQWCPCPELCFLRAGSLEHCFEMQIPQQHCCSHLGVMIGNFLLCNGLFMSVEHLLHALSEENDALAGFSPTRRHVLFYSKISSKQCQIGHLYSLQH